MDDDDTTSARRFSMSSTRKFIIFSGISVSKCIYFPKLVQLLQLTSQYTFKLFFFGDVSLFLDDDDLPSPRISRSVFLHDKTQSPSIKISLFQNRGAAEETFFSVLAHDLSVSCSVSSDVSYDHDLLVPFIPSDAHDQCLFFRFLHLC